MSLDGIKIVRADHQTNSFLGVGSGRCGTLSLAHIVGGCKGVRCRHESYPVTRSFTVDFAEMLKRLRYGGSELHGHIGALWLAVVPLVRITYPHINVVCLHRDKQSTVESFMRRQAARDRPWILNTLGVVEKITPEFAGAHWEWAQRQMAQIPPPVMHMQMADLNNDDALTELYDFLGIDEASRSYPERRQWHRGTEGMPEVECAAEVQ